MTAENRDGVHPAERYCLCMATTTSDASTGLRGRFWLQGDPEDEAIAGRLILMPGANPLLELDEPLTPLMQETSRTKQPDGTEVVTSSPVPSVGPRQAVPLHPRHARNRRTGDAAVRVHRGVDRAGVQATTATASRPSTRFSVTTWTALPPCSPVSASGYATWTPGLACRASPELPIWRPGRKGWPSSRQRFPRRRWPAALR